jgi:hypothetical protein
MRFDLPVSGPEEMSRDELIVVVRRQAGQLAAQGRQISEMAGQLARLMEVNDALAGKLAKLEHLLSRNSGNSSSPPSRDDDPGKPAPPERNKRGRGGPKGTVASVDHCERAGWADASSPCPSASTEV